jgi:ABC-type glycerol-3-phosphate transport system substrate-binding protein
VVATKSFEGVTLTVECDDRDYGGELAKRAAGWAARVGAKVVVLSKSPNDGADLAVIRPGGIGAFAARGELDPVPLAYRDPRHPLQWERTLAVYRTGLTNWSTQPVALTLAADGYALVYRADKFADERHRRGFAAKFGNRPLAAPNTWEDVADVAGYFAEATKAPSLPPLPADPERLLTLYHQVVACYSHESRASSDIADNQENSLHFRVTDTWRHRLDAPAFQHALGWFARTHPFRPPAGTPDDPVTALDTGTAVVAVLTLAEVGRLPRDGDVVSPRFQVAPLPGTRGAFDAAGKFVPVARQANYVPYLGAGGWAGVVFKRSPHAAAAWDLLADLAGPEATMAVVSSPAAGVGPFRVEHLDSPTIWVRYRFDAARTQALADAMRHYVGVNVVNPALTMRTPDRAVLMGKLEPHVRKAATGQTPAPAAMQAAIAEWNDYENAKGGTELTRWRRHAVGLE